MSKRKFGFEGFGINRQSTYSFERSEAPQRLYVPPSSRKSHDNYEDNDLDNIEFDDDANEESNNNSNTEKGGDGGEEE
jgi:ATP-dependent RNA helicase DDX42